MTNAGFLEGGKVDWCLEFTDTVDWRNSEHSKEKLVQYGDLLSWSVKKGVLTEGEAKHLSTITEQNPSAAGRVLKDALRLREAIYHIFSATAHRRPADQKDLGVLNESLLRGLSMRKVDLVGSEFRWAWRDDLSAEAVLYPIAQSAANLLTSEDIIRVKECANEEQGCGSLFLDSSKSHTRKWCSMESCGNRAKFRTYYAKHSHT